MTHYDDHEIDCLTAQRPMVVLLRTSYGQRRFEQALWYAFGRSDESSGCYEETDFANFAADEADEYERGVTFHLDSIRDQFNRFRPLTTEVQP